VSLLASLRSRQVVARYEVDPLVYHGKMRANWAYQLLLTMV
jgi:hypothetical protein